MLDKQLANLNFVSENYSMLVLLCYQFVATCSG